ncbi:NACHT and WD domain-containing protein [Verticillium dahliae VdLs.17]|uniref:NACHT and WD domain-containing protein n=2 Tax=Verticillium dahliae TaxID=27337 RepID=G2WXH2_VERDV|nr:NACHT and WD domain-containing protein [Verticillium dahliae VdLs.17]EGY21427.1 NACHT and WD domain-containing protein [Verticillium dahliae VdLs.17]KAH6707426.1 NACHT and WD domain-containing protein [Verticillium dahliae]
MDWSALSKAMRNDGGKDKDKSSTDYGLHTLVAKDSKSPELIDVVAIHSLNGHFLKTWTDPITGVNWLKDLVPKFLPSARVMSVWYNSQVQFSKSTADIHAFSQQLLESLLAERESIEEQDRPLIFICHSLGGLVFKQAAIKAHENERYRDALSFRFHGVMFFGTPHRGSNLATWASVTANALRAVSFSTSTNARLAKDLEPTSRLLQHISTSFVDSCGAKLKTASFYETRKMDFLNCRRPQSAILNIIGETRIALERDHRTICHFADLDAAQFAPIKSTLRSMADSATASKTLSKHETESFLQTINVSDYAGHKSRNAPPVQGTCTWIFDHPKYLSWIESPDPGLLWVSADPGCGKSVLASFLVNQLQASADLANINVCYFFFKSDSLEQLSAVTGIKTLLYQLCKQQNELAASAMSILYNGGLEDIDSLWQAIVYATRQKAAKNTICILDGLDECEMELRGRLMRQITASFSKVESAEATSASANSSGEKAEADPGDINKRRPKPGRPKLKVFVTSRPENQLKIAFQSNVNRSKAGGGESDSNCALIRLRGEDETDAISADINRVIRSKVDELIHQGLPFQLLQTVQAELVERADRTFLWVSLILDLLEQKVEAGASQRELDELLRNRDIFRIYRELLQLRSESPRARKMLQIILGATRPLTVDELSIALAVEPEPDKPRRGSRTLDDVEYELAYPFENHIKSLCGHFIRIIRERIYLVHETAREFLLTIESETGSSATSRRPSASGTDTPPSLSSMMPSESSPAQLPFQHSFSLADAHRLLLGICTTYIYCLGRPSRCASTGSASKKTEVFLDYAAKYWTVHFHQAMQSRRVASPNMEYHQNLCHPLFPGFKTWVGAFWFPNLAPVVPDSEEGQDYYIELFQLYHPGEELDHLHSQSDFLGAQLDESDDSDVEGALDMFGAREKEAPSKLLHTDVVPVQKQNDHGGRLADRHRTARLLDAAVSNPTSLRNNLFPLEVDKSGHVSLAFQDWLHNGPKSSRRF